MHVVLDVTERTQKEAEGWGGMILIISIDYQEITYNGNIGRYSEKRREGID